MTIPSALPGSRPNPVTSHFCRLILPAWWLLCLLFPGQAAAADACMLYPLSPDLKFVRASLIVEGEVISQHSFWDAARHNIYTSSQVSIYKVFKGQTPPPTIHILTEGGTVGPDKHVFSSTLSLKPGQQGVFYLVPDNSRVLPGGFAVFGSLQGFIGYHPASRSAAAPFDEYPDLNELHRQLEARAGTPYKTVKPNPALQTPATQPPALRPQSPPVILSFSPERVAAGTGDRLTIKGLNFGASRGNGSVEFRNANNGGSSFIKPLETDYILWTNTEIVVKVPAAGTDESPAGTGTFRVTNNDPASAISPTPLQVEFVYTNLKLQGNNQSVAPDHTNENGMGGYTFQFAAGFYTNTPAREAFIRSLNNWTCNTTINWTASGQVTANAAADDNINLVCFDNVKQLPQGVLGRCISRYVGCSSAGNVVYYVKELDLEFDDAARWQFGPAAPAPTQFDFETVALHELGHGHQLGHIIDPGAVMHYAIGPGLQNRQLNPISDIAGGNFVTDRSFAPNACGHGPMTPRAGSDCPLPKELVSFEASFVPDSGVVLVWKTFQERNIASFKVERSPDASNWSEIAAVPAAGTTTGITSYRTIDPKPHAVVNYYRLRIQKADGSFLFSQILEVVAQEVQFNSLEVIENPVKDALRIRYTTDQIVTLNLTLYDAAGRLQKKFNLELGPGANVIALPLNGLGLGLYFVNWTDERQSKTVRIAKITN